MSGRRARLLRRLAEEATVGETAETTRQAYRDAKRLWLGRGSRHAVSRPSGPRVWTTPV